MRRGCPARFVQFARAAVKDDRWCARVFRRDFDILPANPATPSGLQGLERSFFCRESRGIMLSGDGAARFTVSTLSIGEDALSKSRRAFDSLAHAANFDNVDTN